VPITPTAFHWLGLVLICFVLPAVLAWAICQGCRNLGWIKEGDLTLPQ
ncbi:MAG: PTS sugar transporter subunit IIC, partial [Oscillospiraceae bacterium]|nr:PTS sugar transporter subunit IIC [Oscillospiraceae bacterium]